MEGVFIKAKRYPMITFKISGQRFNIPTVWGDLTFAQYYARLSPDYGYTLVEDISLFTGIDKELLAKAELKNLESISIALSFLNVAPSKFEEGPSKMVGPFVMPKDVTIQSTGQFEDLRALLAKVPKQLESREDNMLIADLYLHACAIYVQKIKDGSYDSEKVPGVKEELKNYSCMEIIQTGAFFLFRPLTLLKPTTTRFQNIRQRLKKLIQDFPGFQKTLDSLQHSSESREK